MRRSLLTIAPLALTIFGLLPPVAAGEPVVIGDERALARHLEFEEIAAGAVTPTEVLAFGKLLFKAKFTTEDAAGRPGSTQAIVPTGRQPEGKAPFQRTGGPDANACDGCHNQPTTGGAGEFVANVFVAEGFADAEFDSLDSQFSNERGTPHLFGAGLVELLAREMTA